MEKVQKNLVFWYLDIQVADLTLTQQVGTVGGQSGVNSPSAGLDDLREEPVRGGETSEHRT